MEDTILIGKHLDLTHPGLREALSEHFAVEVFDVLELGRVVDTLADRPVRVAVMRLEYFEQFAPVASVLYALGTRVHHCLAWDDVDTPLSMSDVSRLGLCGWLNMSSPTSTILERIREVSRSCAHHPSEPLLPVLPVVEGAGLPVDGHVDLDAEITKLVARGMSDQQIADLLHYSSQTIRNRISRILRNQGFSNRTELAGAHVRAMVIANLRKSLSSRYGDGQSGPRR